MAGVNVMQRDPANLPFDVPISPGAIYQGPRGMGGIDAFAYTDPNVHFDAGGGALLGGGGGVPPIGTLPAVTASGQVPAALVGPGAASSFLGGAFGRATTGHMLASLIAAAAGLGTRAATGGFSGGSGTGAGGVPPELSQLLAMVLSRAQQQQPLFTAATNQALQGLPAYARGGQ